MTPAQQALEREYLERLPLPVRGIVASAAYDLGHSLGAEEYLSHLDDLVEMVSDVLTAVNFKGVP